MQSQDSECDRAASAIVHMSASTQFDVVLINALRVQTSSFATSVSDVTAASFECIAALSVKKI